MNEQEVLEGIQSNSPKIVLNSLISLADFLDRDAINSQFLDTSYHLLIPLISSNHFKIRSNSLIILSDILENWYDSISDPYLALPGSLLALLSVNKIVSKCGISCLNQILQKENPVVYWMDIEKTITSSRSLEVRIQVLELLTAVSDKIPLIPIVKLVDDPKYQIRRAALELLQTVDMNKLKEAARSVKISYEAMKLLFSTCPELGDMDSLDPNYNKDQFTSKELSVRSKSRTMQDENNNSQDQHPVILQSAKLLKNNSNQNSKPLFASTHQYKSRIPTSNSRNKLQQNENEKPQNLSQSKVTISAIPPNEQGNLQKKNNSQKSKQYNSSSNSRTINRNNNNNYNYGYRSNDDMDGIGIVVRNSKADLLNKARTMPQNSQNINSNTLNQNQNDEHQNNYYNQNLQNSNQHPEIIVEEEEEIDIEIDIQQESDENDKEKSSTRNNANHTNSKPNLVSAQTSPLLPPSNRASNINKDEDDDDPNIDNNQKNSTKKMKITTQSSPTVFERPSKPSAGEGSPTLQIENDSESEPVSQDQKQKAKKVAKKPKSPQNGQSIESPKNGSQLLSHQSPDQNSSARRSPSGASSNNASRISSKQSPSNANASKISAKKSPENGNNTSKISSKQSPSNNNNNNTSRLSAKQSPSNNNNNNTAPKAAASRIGSKQSLSNTTSRVSSKPSPNAAANSSRSSARRSPNAAVSPIDDDDDDNDNDHMQHNFQNDAMYDDYDALNANFANASSNLLQKKLNHSMRRENPRNVSFTEPVGHLESTPTITISYRPEDLSETTWLEKITFLDSISSALSSNQPFTDSPLDLLDCVLIAAFPPHQKVTFMIPPILSELILRHPEIVRKRLNELVTFSLFTMIGDEWQNDGGFDKFLSVFILEADPTDLIETALKVSDETDRKLPFELLIMCVYEEIQDMKLPYSVVSHLVCSLLKRFPLNESQEELFAFICDRELEFVRRYGMKQPLDARHKIVSFIRKSEKFNETENSASLAVSRSKKTQKKQTQITIPKNESQIMKIVNNELKLGPKKSNLQKCLLALTALDGEISIDLFVNFLNYLGKFTETAIYEDEEELSKLCMKHFTSNKFLKIFEANYVLPETVVGFSKIVWCSPQGLLQDSDGYLPVLYDIFKDSSGKVRIDVIKIVIAIEKVTGASILDLNEVVEPYRKLISSLIAQFHYQK